MENPNSVKDDKDAFNMNVLSGALDQYDFSQDSIWGNYGQDSNFQDQDLTFKHSSFSQDAFGITKGGDLDNNIPQYEYSSPDAYHKKSSSPQSFPQKPLIPDSHLSGRQEFVNLNSNNFQNSLHPLDSQEPARRNSSNLVPSQISVPHQLQRNSGVQKTPSPTGQDRIPTKALSEQKGGRRHNNFNKSGKILSKS